jgi:predicted nuclease of predicted toxin-antitoxin system
VRLLLDAHLSGRVIGKALRAAGHDVFALDEHRDLEGIDDEEVLQLASADDRILFTQNVKDFPEILRDWAHRQKSHSGCVILVGVGLFEFGVIIGRIEECLSIYPEQSDWHERAVFAGGAP